MLDELQFPPTSQLKQKNRRGITPYGSLNTQTAEKHNGKEIKAFCRLMSTLFFK
jgi:hypothetical protein